MRIFVNCILIVLCFASLKLTAQKNFFKEGAEAYRKAEYYRAIDCFKKSYEKAKKAEQKAKALFLIGDCYQRIYDYRSASTFFAKCIVAKYIDPIAYYHLARCQKTMQQYNEAAATYTEYLKLVPDADKTFLLSCETAQKWKSQPTNDRVENMALINSKEEDRAVVFGANENSLYFISTRYGGINNSISPCTGRYFSDIYVSACDRNGKWSSPVVEEKFFNSEWSETSLNYTYGIPAYYFTRIAKVKINKIECWKEKIIYSDVVPSGSDSKKKAGLPRFCEIEKDSFNFADPIRIEKNDLIFSSDMPGGFGGYDLWLARWNDGTKAWDEPVNMGPQINSAYDEKCPYQRNSATLYFSSDRAEGMGGFDIYRAKKNANGSLEVSNMKYPVNSAQDELGIVFEKEKERGYLSSNREGGKGSFDIWYFYLK